MLTKYINFKNNLIFKNKKNATVKNHFNDLKNQYFNNNIPLLKSFDVDFKLAYTQKF